MIRDAVTNKLAWMIGGAQGSGVDSSAAMFAKACSYGGLFVYGVREYYSNIMGQHSYFQVRVEEQPVGCHVDHINLLATFDGETVVRHASDVTVDGGIVYDPATVSVKLHQIPTLERRLLGDLRADLQRKGFGETVQDILEDARRRGVQLYPVPYTDLLKQVADEIAEVRLSNLARAVNTMAVASSFALLDYDRPLLDKAIQDTFKGKQKVVEMNLAAAKKAHGYAKQQYNGDLRYRLKTLETGEKRALLAGWAVVALGKLAGGCRFQTYYPITPATDEVSFLEGHESFDVHPPDGSSDGGELGSDERQGGIAVVQTEDEIAAVTMCAGAALTGVRAATSTSGPGFSLMVEGLGWAGMNEAPLVVTLYQRGGPSTGLPTRVGQDELRFALHAGHGEFPRIILASGDLDECFYDAALAFNYAERYQTPTIHLLDKALASSTGTCRFFDLGKVRVERGRLLGEKELAALLESKGGYRRYEITESGVSHRAVLGMRGGVFWATGDERDEYGHITEDPVIRTRMMEKRMKKLELADREIPVEERVNFFGPQEADVTIVSWGSPKGAILEAMEGLSDEGVSVNFLQIRLINPFPANYVTERLSRAKKIVDVEMNYSAQMASLIKERTGVSIPHHIVKYNGRPVSWNEVYDGVKKVLSDDVRRVVLTHGA